PRGERGLAEELYHRALGRSISEYLKVYMSLWLASLERRTGEPRDAAPEQVLAGLRRDGRGDPGVAAWWAGRLGAAGRRAQADTAAKRCEADFYSAMRRFSVGEADGGRALLRKVIETQMMAFFEFDMASYFLHSPPAADAAPQAHGAAATPPTSPTASQPT